MFQTGKKIVAINAREAIKVRSLAIGLIFFITFLFKSFQGKETPEAMIFKEY